MLVCVSQAGLALHLLVKCWNMKYGSFYMSDAEREQRLKWSKKNPGRVSWIPGSPPNVLCLLPYLPLHHRPNHCRHHHREISGWTYILVNIFSYPHHCSHHMPNYHWDVSNQTYVCQRLVISNISTIITTTNIPFWSPTPPGTVPPNSISPPVKQP